MALVRNIIFTYKFVYYFIDQNKITAKGINYLLSLNLPKLQTLQLSKPFLKQIKITLAVLALN